jgi:hypothetical protein
MTNNKPHQSDTGFIPTANGDGITVKRVELARDSWLFFCVSRRRPGEYFILAGGPHIGGGGKDATPEEAANYLLNRSPHWETLMKLTKELVGMTCTAIWQ